MWASFLKWLMFQICFGLLPIGLNAVRILAEGDSFTWTKILSRGELLLISCALSAGAIGDIVAINTRHIGTRIVAVGCCVVSLFLGAYSYAQLSGQISSGNGYNAPFVAVYSTWLYLFSVVASGGCIFLGEENQV